MARAKKISLRTLFLPHTAQLKNAVQTSFVSAHLENNVLDKTFSMDGAKQVADMGYQRVLLSFFQDFPANESDYAHFATAVRHYHQENVQVWALISISTYAVVGKYKSEQWYAQDSYEQPIYHHHNTRFTIPTDEKWLDEIKTQIDAALECGVDGICFYAMSAGGYGLDTPLVPLGVIGSYDSQSEVSFRAATNLNAMPQILNPARLKSQKYFQWRATEYSSVIAKLRDHLLDKDGDCEFITLVDSPFAHNLLMHRGIDYDQLLELNPTVAARMVLSDKHGVQHRLPLAMLLNEMPQHYVFDDCNLYGQLKETTQPLRYYLQLLAESIALNANLLVNGLIVRKNNRLSSLLHSRYETHQTALTTWNQWLAQQQSWLNERKNISPLAIYCPLSELHTNWTQKIHNLEALIEIFMQSGLPLRVITAPNLSDETLKNVRVLVCPTEITQRNTSVLQQYKQNGGKIISVGQKKTTLADVRIWNTQRWSRIRFMPLPIRPALRQFNRLINSLVRLYYQQRWFQVLVRFGWRKRFLRRWFRMNQQISVEQKQALLSVLPKNIPVVEAEAPILFTMWQNENGDTQYHIVNQSQESQQVQIHLHDLTIGKTFVPAEDTTQGHQVIGSSFLLTIDVMKILYVSLPSEES